MSSFSQIQKMSSQQLFANSQELIKAMAERHGLEVASPRSKFVSFTGYMV